MEESLEERLARLEERSIKPTKGALSGRIWIYRFQIVVLAVILLLTGVGLVVGRHLHSSSSPLPTTVVKQASYPVYYPSKLPDGYSYTPASAQYDHSTVSYTLEHDTHAITITQQANPKEKIVFEKLPGFTLLGTTIGQAATGTVNGRQVVIAQTATTLITITAEATTPPSVLSAITQSLVEITD
jgi:hypothetical protein